MYIKGGVHPTHDATSNTGWKNNYIGLAWLEQVFDYYTKKQALQKYPLLIFDGHGSHITNGFLEYCQQRWIIVAIFRVVNNQFSGTHKVRLDLIDYFFRPKNCLYSLDLSLLG